MLYIRISGDIGYQLNVGKQKIMRRDVTHVGKSRYMSGSLNTFWEVCQSMHLLVLFGKYSLPRTGSI